MRGRWGGLAGLGAVLLHAGVAVAQGQLTGTVRQDSTGTPLAGVEVLLLGTGRQTVTDAAGRYAIPNPPAGRHNVLFRLIGYLPVREGISFVAGDTVWLNPLLVPGVARLEDLEVKSRPDRVSMGVREGFEERRRMGFGKFLDSTYLRANEHEHVDDLLRRVQGLHLVWYKRELRAISQNGRCWLSVFLDGFLLYRSSRNEPPTPPDFSRDFSVADLEAIEFYRSAAQLPAEFNGSSSACGVVVLWSRRGS